MYQFINRVTIFYLLLIPILCQSSLTKSLFVQSNHSKLNPTHFDSHLEDHERSPDQGPLITLDGEGQIDQQIQCRGAHLDSLISFQCETLLDCRDKLECYHDNNYDPTSCDIHLTFGEPCDPNMTLEVDCLIIPETHFDLYVVECENWNGSRSHRFIYANISMGLFSVPIIARENPADPNATVLIGFEQKDIFCNFTGQPPPDVTWYLNDGNDVTWAAVTTPGQSRLAWESAYQGGEGLFSCYVENIEGFDTLSFSVQFPPTTTTTDLPVEFLPPPEEGTNWTLIIEISAGGVGLILLIILGGVGYWKRAQIKSWWAGNKKSKFLSDNEVKEFTKGRQKKPIIPHVSATKIVDRIRNVARFPEKVDPDKENGDADEDGVTTQPKMTEWEKMNQKLNAQKEKLESVPRIETHSEIGAKFEIEHIGESRDDDDFETDEENGGIVVEAVGIINPDGVETIMEIDEIGGIVEEKEEATFTTWPQRVTCCASTFGSCLGSLVNIFPILANIIPPSWLIIGIVIGASVSLEAFKKFTQMVPFNAFFEIPASSFTIDKASTLGQGKFGKVYKGSYNGRPVAVKSNKDKKKEDKGRFKALLMEVKIMSYVGHHPNIVEFVGAHTLDIQNGIIHVVMELCTMGNLENYLIKRRYDFVSVSTIGPYFMPKYTGNELTTYELLNFSVQIASGMKHLWSKQVIHGDLAIRNVLVFPENVVKITDFGLSRKLYSPQYVNNEKSYIPWTHMALESFKSQEYSSSTDAWSYGVTMWEIFSLGEVPYADVSFSSDFVAQLEEGIRLHKPDNASKEIYEIMLKCWLQHPASRPSFDDLEGWVRAILDDYPTWRNQTIPDKILTLNVPMEERKMATVTLNESGYEVWEGTSV